MHYLSPFPEGRRFKKGERPANWQPIGSETVNANGQVMVKVGLPSVWRSKHQVLWEEANGPLPKGARLTFADGNQRNIALDNLVAVYRPAIGDEKIGGDGFIHVKVAEPNKWKRKHYLIWEEAYGPVPQSHKLLFIDGQPGNCYLENLVMVPKKENWRLKDIFAGAGARKKLIDLCRGQKQLAAPKPETCSKTETAATPKPSRNDPRIRPLGAERIRKACGRIQIKIAHPKVWKFKHIVIWEEAHGPVPKGAYLSFIDGDRKNCCLENLELMPNGYQEPTMTMPVGSEIKRKKGNKVKVEQPNVWKYKHLLIWEKAYGPVPEGHVLEFIDGDCYNCTLGNLSLRKKLGRELNRKGGTPLGTETITKNNYILVKITNNVWRYKHRLIWEEAHGPVPKGCYIGFIDGDKKNCCLENLQAMPISYRHQEPTMSMPVGSEIKRKIGIKVKVKQPNVWKYKHLLIWEKAYGPVPEGHVLEFIDGDCYNCTLGNLSLRKKLGRELNRKGGTPLGTETITKDNRIQVKVANNVWRYKHRLVWEEAHGPVPKGYRIVFADNNSLNCDLDNLLLLSNKEFGQRVGYGLFFEDSDLNKNVAAILKLGSSIKKVKEKLE